MFFAAWATTPDFPAAEAAHIAESGSAVQITWEPWDPAAGATQPRYALEQIASGGHDAYIVRWATQVEQYGAPVELRFAHEMNGHWYPWSTGGRVPQNTARSYKKAWRHVHGLFVEQGVDNVSWVWSPNVSYEHSRRLDRLYPGDAFVDVVGVDGYNFGTTAPHSRWVRPARLFDRDLVTLRELTDKPLVVAEVGSTEVGGSKARWIRQFFSWLSRNPDVAGFTWFNHAKETDWRISSSPSAEEAFRTGLASIG